MSQAFEWTFMMRENLAVESDFIHYDSMCFSGPGRLLSLLVFSATNLCTASYVCYWADDWTRDFSWRVCETCLFRVCGVFMVSGTSWWHYHQSQSSPHCRDPSEKGEEFTSSPQREREVDREITDDGCNSAAHSCIRTSFPRSET